MLPHGLTSGHIPFDYPGGWAASTLLVNVVRVFFLSDVHSDP